MSEEKDLEVFEGSDNAFHDFGHPDAEILQMKADLAAKIIRVLDERKMSVRGAATLTGYAAADFSRVRRAKVRGFTLDKLVGMLGKLDQQVEIVVQVRQRPALVAPPLV